MNDFIITWKDGREPETFPAIVIKDDQEAYWASLPPGLSVRAACADYTGDYYFGDDAKGDERQGGHAEVFTSDKRDESGELIPSEKYAFLFKSGGKIIKFRLYT